MAVAQSTEAIVLDWSQPPEEPPAPGPELIDGGKEWEPGSWEAYTSTPSYSVESAYRQAQWDDPSRGGSGTDFATFDLLQESPDWGRKEAKDVLAAQYPELSQGFGDVNSNANGLGEMTLANGLAYLPRDFFAGTEPVRKTSLLAYGSLPGDVSGYYNQSGYIDGGAVIVAEPRWNAVLPHEAAHHIDLKREQPWSSDPEFLNLIANAPPGAFATYEERWGPYYGADFDANVPKEILAEETWNYASTGRAVTPEITEYLANNVVRSRPTADNPYLQRSAMFDRYEAYRSYDQRVREMLANRR